MLKKEFEERTGKTVTAEEYQKIHRIYMMTVNMDKDEFCKEWKKIGASERMVSELAKYAKDSADERAELMRQIRELKKEREEMARKITELEENEDGEDVWMTRAIDRLQEWKAETKQNFVCKTVESGMKPDDLYEAIRIVSTALSCKVQFNTPVNDNYSHTHDILILESNASVIEKLHNAGYSLSMTEKGLSVTKY